MDEVEYQRTRQEAEKLTPWERAIFEFLVSSGVRSMELVGLKICDININKRQALVLGKGGKTRTIGYSSDCKIMLKELIKDRPINDSVFITDKGHPVKAWIVYRTMTALGKVACVSGILHPHRLRHTYASRESLNGKPLKKIKEDLGHAYETTTLIYCSQCSYG